jgi:phage tail tape-measure protein
MVDTRFQDGRVERRDLAGTWTGVAAGSLAGIALVAMLPIWGTIVDAAIGVVLGGALGGWLGKTIIAQISADDWEPLTSRRSYVGARAPDTDTP